jgi:hypothetical protein
MVLLLPDHTKWGDSLKYIAYTLWFLGYVVAFIIKTLSGEPMRRRRGVPPHLPY